VEGRPRYPAALIAAAAAVTGWRPDSRILEIGSGPGTATQDFAALGGRFTCVEPNADFVALAREILAPFPDVSFQTSTLEQADLPVPFDIVLAASSFHWIDQQRGVRRIGEVLAPGGFANANVLMAKEDSLLLKFSKDLFYELLAGNVKLPRQSRDDVAAVFRGLAGPLQTEAFEERLFCHVELAEDYGIERFVALHRSLSPFLALAPERQERVAEALTGNLRALLGPVIPTTRISAAHIFQKAER